MSAEPSRRRRQIGVVGSTIRDIRVASADIREGLIELANAVYSGVTEAKASATSTPTAPSPLKAINTELRQRCSKLQARIPELEAKAIESHRRVEQARAEAQAKLDSLNIDIKL